MPRSSLSRMGCTIALVAATALAGCSGGSSTPAAPTTGHQAIGRLLTNAELPDGIKTDDYPNSSSLSGGPPFTQVSCTNLIDPAGFFFNNGPRALIFAAQELAKPPPPNAVDPEVQSWGGLEYLIVYRGDGAEQAMTGLSQVVRGCSRSAPNMNGNGITVTLHTHLSTISGLGDLALDVQVRTQEANGASGPGAQVRTQASSGALSIASDWIVIRSGNVLLVVSEQVTVETQYLLPVAQAAWKAYSQ